LALSSVEGEEVSLLFVRELFHCLFQFYKLLFQRVDSRFLAIQFNFLFSNACATISF